MNSIIFIMEMIGTVAFAISGVLAAKEKKMDLFGAVTLGCTTAVGGGMVRDLILGQTPPIMFLQPIYTEVAFVTSILYFVFEKRTHRQSGEHVTNCILRTALDLGSLLLWEVLRPSVPDMEVVSFFVRS